MWKFFCLAVRRGAFLTVVIVTLGGGGAKRPRCVSLRRDTETRISAALTSQEYCDEVRRVLLRDPAKELMQQRRELAAFLRKDRVS